MLHKKYTVPNVPKAPVWLVARLLAGSVGAGADEIPRLQVAGSTHRPPFFARGQCHLVAVAFERTVMINCC